ncbi:phage tail sheath subtilisin-like domain-containing protein [Burkholderia sp. BCCIQ04A]|uniref:Phage tail sheath subtilisin-like domain-containing protein n=1 Tax=Burkholderia anthinoferrum TaxID=3090833 RepID=A0ABU5WNL7_9BURK|nr:phage tail sheath subtilisin-like domain-containing protein [Burkholderia anthinoferrum]MEB2504641.1 phage tail sheath subtilisin-like domain-containing protein [Burkholderia anthinoferrum]MEB2530309.1 phage tail sheath subtilisin-like domain-containing protein [Burkholderia anthinoferrum]MEB2561682.1 phage tail sheath subtilisin-like domain-containing protein [Burkholderia anthinoferrum]MEB2580567.1 phage tail sheath subtilisin-like domain-containing protein [Burkholderia anthinoferrum]MEB
MTVPFKQIPQNIRTPLFFAEIDNSRANTAVTNQRALLIGPMTTGAATANIPLLSAGTGDANVQFGANSILALMTAAYRQNDQFGEVWCLPIADAGGAVAATGSIAFTAAPTANGVISLYVADQLVSVPVTQGMTTAQIATAVAAAINLIPAMPATAAAATNTVTLTADNKGLVGNDIDIRFNKQGAPGGEILPAGLTATITAMTGGATNPALTTALGNLLDMPFDFIACAFTDTTSMDAIKAFLNDSTGRWSWQQQVFGHAFYAYRGTWGSLTTFGTARNNQHETVIGFNDSPTPSWQWAASLAAVTAVSVRADPGIPMQTVALTGISAPPLQSRFNLSQRNTLLYDGISTFTVADDGTVAIENLITTYQTNAFGQPDNSYLEIETMFLLAYVLRRLRTLVTSKYARVKLAADGTRFAPGSAIVTPKVIKADLIAEYHQMEYEGYVQGSDIFAQALIVQQNDSNPNRVDVLWPGILINQLRIFALLAQFRLSTTQT